MTNDEIVRKIAMLISPTTYFIMEAQEKKKKAKAAAKAKAKKKKP
mgnify:FL=1